LRLLLDTHIALWVSTEHESLSRGELATLIDPANELAVSAVSIWEMRIKWESRFRSGERKEPTNPLALLVALEALGLPVEPLDAVQAGTALNVPLQHNDRFDVLLLTIAQETGRKLLTRNEKLRGHPLAFHAI
jgi:PIN domain nuclease of toxin-antitoxin system